MGEKSKHGEIIVVSEKQIFQGHYGNRSKEPFYVQLHKDIILPERYKVHLYSYPIGVKKLESYHKVCSFEVLDGGNASRLEFIHWDHSEKKMKIDIHEFDRAYLLNTTFELVVESKDIRLMQENSDNFSWIQVRAQSYNSGHIFFKVPNTFEEGLYKLNFMIEALSAKEPLLEFTVNSLENPDFDLVTFERGEIRIDISKHIENHPRISVTMFLEESKVDEKKVEEEDEDYLDEIDCPFCSEFAPDELQCEYCIDEGVLSRKVYDLLYKRRKYQKVVRFPVHTNDEMKNFLDALEEGHYHLRSNRFTEQGMTHLDRALRSIYADEMSVSLTFSELREKVLDIINVDSSKELSEVIFDLETYLMEVGYLPYKTVLTPAKFDTIPYGENKKDFICIIEEE
jgi:hypothetical protein